MGEAKNAMYYNTPTHQIFTHNLVGNDKRVSEIGDMGIELALWLEFLAKLESDDDYYNQQRTTALATLKRAEEIATLESLSPTPKSIIPPTQLIPPTQTETDNSTPEINYMMDARCSTAAIFGYKPPLLEKRTRKLTLHGKEMILKIAVGLDMLRAEDEHQKLSLLDPANWTNPTHAFFQATITNRSCRLLIAITRATTAVAEKYKIMEKTRNDEFLALFADRQDVEETSQSAQSALQALQSADFPKSRLATILEVVRKNESVQDLLVRTSMIGDRPLTYVPTSSLSEKHKKDINELIRYGLVDVRYMHMEGQRGRPRRIVTPSPVGRLTCQYLLDHDFNLTA